jgi:hypothetical protein
MFFLVLICIFAAGVVDLESGMLFVRKKKDKGRKRLYKCTG